MQEQNEIMIPEEIEKKDRRGGNHGGGRKPSNKPLMVGASVFLKPNLKEKYFEKAKEEELTASSFLSAIIEVGYEVIFNGTTVCEAKKTYQNIKESIPRGLINKRKKMKRPLEE